MAAILALATVTGGLVSYYIYLHQSGRIEPASVEKMALVLPDKPSIAVLPFDNLSGDIEQDFLADGLTETIIASLAQSPDLFVIARNSVFTYKGKATKVQQVAEDLGIRYVLEGSVQRFDDRLRVTAQLNDAINGRHLWANQYDRSVEHFFDVQDEITHKFFIEMHVALTKGEHGRVSSRGTRSINALLLRMKGLAEGSKFTKDGMLKARELYGMATEVDPKYARAWAGLAWSYWYESMMGGWGISRDEALQKAIKFAEHAVEVDPQDPVGYQFLANCMSLKGEHDRAVDFAEKAVDLAPSDFQANGTLGTTLMWAEEPKRGLYYLDRAKRLSPSYPAWVDMNIGLAQLMVEQYEEAVTSMQQGVNRSPKSFVYRGRLIAALVAAGNLDGAKTEATELMELKPDFNISAFVKTNRFKDPARREWLTGLLQKAGLPANP